MPKAIYFVSYKLKKGAAATDFLAASKRLDDEFISKQKGYVGWEQYFDAKRETWADSLVFESMDDLENFLEQSRNPNETALNFYSFINSNSCKTYHFSLERSN